MNEPKRVDVARLQKRVGEVAALSTGRRLDVDEVLDNALEGEVQSGLAAVRANLWRQQIPNRFQWAELEHFSGEVHRELASWSAQPAGRNLVLFGPVGAGKTHAAVAACRKAHFDGLSVEFWPLVELLDQLRPGGDPEMFDRLVDVDRLIIDDLGAERSTEWTDERLYAVINRRWLEELPTVATTNLTPAALEESLGARAFSRLVGSDAVALQLSGPDRRRAR